MNEHAILQQSARVKVAIETLRVESAKLEQLIEAEARDAGVVVSRTLTSRAARKDA